MLRCLLVESNNLDLIAFSFFKRFRLGRGRCREQKGGSTQK